MPDHGSLTKEFPLVAVEQTITAITPNMRYRELLRFANANTQSAIPGLLRQRFLLVDASQRIIYDEFLALVAREGVTSVITRKAMLFTWLYRDDRLRRFILERVANPDGRWSATKLINKANADFFTGWGGAKARSNFENFLAEIGIYNRPTRSVHLDLSDNWLEDAARIACQYESDADRRRQLRENPYKFLADEEWNALVNATSSELSSRSPAISFAVEEVEDDSNSIIPARLSQSRIWNRPPPQSGDRASMEALINLVARERANRSHHAIEQLLADKIRRSGNDPKLNAHIDMFYVTTTGSVLAEVKSCTQNNVHKKIRTGVSQLFEYRYAYGNQLTPPIHLLLVIEVEPGPEKRWLVDYLREIGITVAWADVTTREFRTRGPVAEVLSGLIPAG